LIYVIKKRKEKKRKKKKKKKSPVKRKQGYRALAPKTDPAKHGNVWALIHFAGYIIYLAPRIFLKTN
jgi:hypothetical protein